MYAVVDLETTGLWPQRSDRVLEIAIIQLDLGLAITDVWTTLVNPERDVGPVRLHGITASDVVDAPTFRQLASPLAARLSGAVLVGHNLRFDAGAGRRPVVEDRTIPRFADARPDTRGAAGQKRYNRTSMSIEELEAEALKLDPAARARLAERLLESLEDLSDEENARIWAEEARRRDEEWDANPDAGRPAEEVHRDLRAKLK